MSLKRGALERVWTTSGHPLTLRRVKPDVRALLGERIRQRRAELNFTQEGFAHYTGLARTYYGRIERGQQNVSLEKLVWLAAHLETSVADLTRDLNADVCLAFVGTGREVD